MSELYPSDEEIEPPDFNHIHVDACHLTRRQVFYECPFCFKSPKSYKVFTTNKTKSGKIIKSRKPTLHRHGNSNGTRGNWTEERFSHCTVNDAYVYIHITDKTERYF
jgi:hypothetical protein